MSEPIDLLIWGLSTRTSEDQVLKYVQGLGKISKLELKHKWDGTGETKGYGYVRFADKDVENQVLSKPHLIDGCMCDIKIPDAKRRKRKHTASEIKAQIAHEKKRRKEKTLLASTYGQYQRQCFLIKRKNARHKFNYEDFLTSKEDKKQERCVKLGGGRRNVGRRMGWDSRGEVGMYPGNTSRRAELTVVRPSQVMPHPQSMPTSTTLSSSSGGVEVVSERVQEPLVEMLEQKKEKLDFKRRQLEELAKRVAVRVKEGIKVSVMDRLVDTFL